MLPRVLAVPALLLAVLLGLLGLAACSSGGEDDSGGASSSAAGDSDAGATREDAPGAAYADGSAVDSDALRSAADAASPAESDEVTTQQALIRKGNVALRADDVGKAQFEVQQLVDRVQGQVTEEKTSTDDDGRPAYTRMVLRIPTARFDDTMDDLKAVEGAELESASTSEEDVTAQLIDTETRLQAQRRSIDRISVLFDRAENINEIMRIESELSRRQADLESLERRAAFLRNQTSMSTITVSIDQIPDDVATDDQDTDEAGFLSGLSAGWGSLTTFAVGLATALGALLPWLAVLGILGIPAYLIWRRRRAGSSGRTPSAA